MNDNSRWKKFLQYWDTVYAADYDCPSILVWEIRKAIRRIKEEDETIKKLPKNWGRLSFRKERRCR